MNEDPESFWEALLGAEGMETGDEGDDEDEDEEDGDEEAAAIEAATLCVKMGVPCMGTGVLLHAWQATASLQFYASTATTTTRQRRHADGRGRGGHWAGERIERDRLRLLPRYVDLITSNTEQHTAAGDGIRPGAGFAGLLAGGKGRDAYREHAAGCIDGRTGVDR